MTNTVIPNTSTSGPFIIQPVVGIGVSGSVLATITSEMQRQQEVILSFSIFAGLTVYIYISIWELRVQIAHIRDYLIRESSFNMTRGNEDIEGKTTLISSVKLLVYPR